MSAKAKVLSALSNLHKEGVELLYSEIARVQPDDYAKGNFPENPGKTLHLEYQAWYSKCLRVLKVVNPERIEEFSGYYQPEKNRKFGFTSYKIKDYLMAVRFPSQEFSEFSAFTTGIQQQIAIIYGAHSLASDRLADIEATLLYEILGDELGAAEDLLKAGALRAAGAISGVAIEQHLKAVCSAHEIKLKKRNPGLGDFNQALRDAEIIDVPTWRRHQALGDIRNICVHSRSEEPSKDQVRELIDGAKRVIAEVS